MKRLVLILIFLSANAMAASHDVTESVLSKASNGDQLVTVLESELGKYVDANPINLSERYWGLVINGEVVSVNDYKSVDVSAIDKIVITTDGMRAYRKAIIDVVIE